MSIAITNAIYRKGTELQPMYTIHIYHAVKISGEMEEKLNKVFKAGTQASIYIYCLIR